MLVGAAVGAAMCALILILRWAFRFASAQQGATGGRGKAGTVGMLSMLVAVVIGSAAAGGLFAARPEEEPYPRATGVVLACSVVLMLVGIALKAGAARRPNIHVAGVRGRALIRSVRRGEARSIQGLPVYEIDMDASGPDIPLDDDLDEPPPRSIAPVTQPLPEDELPPVLGAPTAGTRTIALVLVMALLGTAASYVTSALDSGAPAEIVADPAAARPRLDGFFSSPETRFSVVLPPGWTREPAEEGLALRSGDASIVVERAPRLERTLWRVDGVIPRFFDSVQAKLRYVERRQPVFLGADLGMRYDLPPRSGSRRSLVVAVRMGRVYAVRVVAPEAEWSKAAPALADVVDSWIWYRNH